MNVLLTFRNGLILSLAAFAMSGCTSDNDDLDRYINEIKARPGGRIDPLPEITPYEVFTYVADAEGLSYYGDAALATRLPLDVSGVRRARGDLIEADLIAYEAPLYQVLSLGGGR